jgi:RND superfamily putative drug exporter
VLATALLLAMAYPALHMKTRDMSVTDMPKTLPVLQAYTALEKAFPSQGASETVVFESADVHSATSQAGIAHFKQQVGENKAFTAVDKIEYSHDSKVAQINVPIVGGDDKDVGIAATRELRGTVIPDTLALVPGAQVHTTGDAASSLDFNDNLKKRAPLVFAFVLGLAFLLMLVTFRSIVIPFTAIALNLLSVGAAYGVLVLVFQHGWGHELLGFTPNGAIWPFLPLFLFVVLFGLSMDYHVFILSRIREGHESGLGNDDAVRFGIRSTAGVVTSAAIVMLFGAANWYLPRWLEWLPKVRYEDSAQRPVAAPEAAGAGA